jgi:methylenetetrahydrofolate dehydrogenase (NADP+) / methenyltetrahydrofolate cyclohydrolase
MTDRLDGKPVAEELTRQARTAVDRGRAGGLAPPGLASVHRGAATPFAVYLRRQARAAEAAGVAFREAPIPAPETAQSLRTVVAALDADPAVHAILLEHPLPPELDFFSAIRSIRPEKDVDGVGPANLGLLVSRREMHAPAVARGAMAIARHYAVALAGRRVAVIGRSESVGIPLALLLLARGEGADATVTVAHSRTSDLGAALHGVEVIFSCAGHPGLLNRSTVPRGAAVIDVGLSTVPDPARPTGQRVVGDADAGALDGWAGALTPVPGGVGPVTVAQLMVNAVDGWRRQVGGADR